MSMIAKAATLSVIPVPASAGIDPVFAVLEALEVAWASYSATTHEVMRLDEILPDNLTRSRNSDDMVSGDDPNYIAAVLADSAAGEEWDRLTVELLNVKPTTLQGVVAVLQWVDNHEQREKGWGAWTPVQDDDVFGEDWNIHFHHYLAAALVQITSPPAMARPMAA